MSVLPETCEGRPVNALESSLHPNPKRRVFVLADSCQKIVVAAWRIETLSETVHTENSEEEGRHLSLPFSLTPKNGYLIPEMKRSKEPNLASLRRL